MSVINKKIIQVHQQIKIDANKSTDIRIDPLMISLFFLCSVSLAIYINTHLKDTTNFPTLVIIVPLLLSFAMMSQSNITNREVFFYYLHFIIPGKAKRLAEINAFILDNEIVSKLQYECFLDDEKFKNLTKHNIKEWTDAFIAKESSIHNLICTRVLGSRELRMGVIYWSQLIPRDKLKTDQLRTILQNCLIVD